MNSSPAETTLQETPKAQSHKKEYHFASAIV